VLFAWVILIHILSNAQFHPHESTSKRRLDRFIRFAQHTLVAGNESVPKIILNSTINLLFKTAISILAISNRNSFRVLFDKIASVYFGRKNIFIF